MLADACVPKDFAVASWEIAPIKKGRGSNSRGVFRHVVRNEDGGKLEFFQKSFKDKFLDISARVDQPVYSLDPEIYFLTKIAPELGGEGWGVPSVLMSNLQAAASPMSCASSSPEEDLREPTRAPFAWPPSPGRSTRPA